MPYEPLHHKYRPQSFAELVGQEAIATTLSNALQQRRIAPAYLFTGPRGTGKTSSARILAKSLNCLSADQPTPTPCGQCEVCQAIARGSALDVIEIDAASNTGVDNIRELIERSQFSPVQCRYKVYVIDECHMLSVAAFNALLKTLEEPPAHVVFVLATTDPQRVLPTIISRCQRFDYRRIPLDAMVQHLQKIAQLEAIHIPLESVTLIAQIANGGLRDAESLLDQLSLLAGEITADKVWDLVGAVPERDLLTLLQVIRSNQAEAVIQQCRHLLNRGREPLVVLQNLASFYLNLLIAKTAPQRDDLVAVTKLTWQELCEEARAWQTEVILKGQQHLKDNEYQLKNTTQPRLWLEITLLGLLPSALQSVPAASPPFNPSSSQATAAPPSAKVEPDLPAATAAPASSVTPISATPLARNPMPAVEAQPEIKQTSTPLPASDTEVAQNRSATGSGTLASSAAVPLSTPSPAAPAIHFGSVQPPPPSQPEPPAEAESIPAESTSSSVISALEREELWAKALDQLPALTQALLRPHGNLVAFNGGSALIGMKSQKLIKVAKGQVKNVEAAFNKVCDRPIKVSFQVGQDPSQILTEEHFSTNGDSAPTVEPPTPHMRDPFESSPATATPNLSAPPPITTVPGSQAATALGSPAPTAQPSQPLNPTPQISLAHSVEPAIAPEGVPLHPEEDGDSISDVQAVAQRFAQAFEGEVIQLEHLAVDNTAATQGSFADPSLAPMTTANVLTLATSEPPSRAPIPPEISPEEDIPF